MKTLLRSSFGHLGRAFLATTAVLTLGLGSAAAHNKSPGPSSIKGVWDVRVNITNCVDGAAPGSKVPGETVLASFNALNIFAGDGTFLDTNSTNPTLRSQHFGYWRHLKSRNYEFVMKIFLFDETGQNIGWRIVRHDVVLARNGLSFKSGGTAETFNSDGELLPPPGAPAGTPPGLGCSTSKATRFY